MGNADSVCTGGLNGAIGPVLMRKVVPLTIRTQDISVPESAVYRDSIFTSVAERLRKVSFHADSSARSPEFSARVQTVARQLSQVVAHKRFVE